MAITNTSKLSTMIRHKGFNHSQFAKVVGISDAMMHKIMMGWKDPSLELAERMAKTLGVTVDDLISK